MMTNNKHNVEKQRQLEDRLDEKLFEIMEMVSKPEKFGITLDGRVIDVYPHVFLDSLYCIKKVEYKPFKYLLEQELPQELFKRYEQLLKDTKQVNHKVYKDSTSRKNYVKVSPEMSQRIVELYQQGVTRQEICYEVGVSRSAVNSHIKKQLGSQKVKPPEHNEADIQDWAEFKELGFTFAEIAEGYDVTESTINYHTKRIGAKNKSAGRPSKYPPKMVDEWNTLKDSGAIGKVYNVPKGTIKHYVAKYRENRTINSKAQYKEVK
ncbi:hypothetical protein Q75_09710 [Bacillus coahuilensis p1.1.43]|uniref:Uncharacterized protein n=1 Tax=Bacillus coahuilensis p1.1.43 TaxID=1150625 RepID=A0A147K7V1_9BACI|nr:helix-turn-helix domain-containing protein [Bacillus coahuilensis]KUP06196.1 hypothetical protein Q75_09710 [Bacillus coahuilensis p1.1.43]